MPNYFNNIHLIALSFLAFFAFSLTGEGGSLVSALPTPSIPSYSSPVHHNIRHHKHRKMYFISNARPLDCPPNKVRGHDGDCYRAFRSRRSVGEVPKIDPCLNQPGYIRDHFGGCSRVLNNNNRLKRSSGSTFSQTRESHNDVHQVRPSCPQGYTMNSDGFCLQTLSPAEPNLLQRNTLGEPETSESEESSSIDQHKVLII